MNCVIRKVDIGEILEIAEVYCEEENLKVEKEYVDSAKLAYQKMLNKGDYILGAFNGENRLMGCISVHYLDDVYPGYTEGGYVHVETVIIRKKYRGVGLATMLIEQAVEMAKKGDVKYCIIQTGDNNYAARRAFEKAGFKHHNVNYCLEF